MAFMRSSTFPPAARTANFAIDNIRRVSSAFEPLRLPMAVNVSLAFAYLPTRSSINHLNSG